MVTSAKLIHIFDDVCKFMQQNKDYLNELDKPIGDSDHGSNLSRGFVAVSAKLPTLSGKDAGTVLKTVGMTLVSTVGGSSGPLYGTAFMKAGARMAGKMELTIDDFTIMLHEGVEGIKMRGKATTGEATMLDAMVPALEALKNTEGTAQQRLKACAIAAAQGAEATRNMIATKGRASYLGERSLGHVDPGAVSFTLILAEAVRHLI